MQYDPTRFQRGWAQRWAASAAAGGVSRLAAPLVGFLLTPYLLEMLGRDGYGLYALSLGLASWLGAIDLGLVPGLRVLAARRSANLAPRELEIAVSSCAAGQFPLAALTLMGGALLAVAAPWFTNDPRVSEHAVTELIFLLGAGSAISVAAHFYSGALEAHQLGYVDRTVRLARTVIRALAAVALVETGFGLAALGWAHVIAAACGAVLSALGARRYLPEMRIDLSVARWSSLRETGRLGLWLSAGTVAGLLITGADRIVTAKIFRLETVAVLAVSSALFALGESLINHLLDAVRPLLAQSLGAGDRARAAGLYRPTCVAAVSIGIAAACAAFAANPAFVAAWAGAENHGGVWLDAALGVALVLQVWTSPHRAALSSSLQVRQPTWIRLAEGALNLPVSIMLAVWLGLPGVVWGTVVAALLTSAWSLPQMACLRLGLPPSEALWIAAKALPPAALLVPASYFARGWGVEVGGLLGAGLAGGLTLLGAALLFWLFGLDDLTRRTLRRPFAWAS